MRSIRRYLPAIAALAAAGIVLRVGVGLAIEPTIEAAGGGTGGFRWQPSSVEVSAGGGVRFQNPSASVPHGVVWTGGPETPNCSGIPIGKGETKWKGTCTFTHAGTYTFHCYVHPTEMTGSITVTVVGAPIVSTGEASAVSQTAATLNGMVNPQGKPTSYFFNYGTTTSYGQKTSEQAAGEGSLAEPVSASLSSLPPSTTIHFQLVAKNASGTTLGADQTVTTASLAGAPTAITGPAAAVTETGAMLTGTVNPDGQATKYLFEWGTTSTYGRSTAELPAGEDHAGHMESAALSGLVAGTAYHFRLRAMNASGPASGADQTFMTVSPPATTTGTTTTTSAATPTATLATLAAMTVEPFVGSPLVGSPSLRSSQRGPSVRGSVDVSQSGAGGRLEVDLLARSALLARATRSGSGLVRVGRLVRASVSAGNVSFSVSLTARGKRALARRHRLALTVKITLTPVRGTAVTVTRGIVVRR
jgi:plastocyanin